MPGCDSGTAVLQYRSDDVLALPRSDRPRRDAKASGCGGTETYSVGADQWLNTRTVGSAQVTDPGVPVGTYDICVEARGDIGQGVHWYKLTKSNETISNPDGELISFDPYRGDAFAQDQRC